MNIQQVLCLLIILAGIGIPVSGSTVFSEITDIQSSSHTVRPVFSGLSLPETPVARPIIPDTLPEFINRYQENNVTLLHSRTSISPSATGSDKADEKTDSGPGYGLASESYRYVTQWGEMPRYIKGPFGVAVDKIGNVYASSYDDNSIMKFNKSGGFVTNWSSWNSSSDGFIDIFGVETDSAGNILVVDSDRILRFDQAGGYLSSFGEDFLIHGAGLAVNPIGNVYVADLYNQSVVVFNSTGGYLFSFGETRLLTPNGVALGSGGNIYVTDETAGCVQVFNSTGGYIGQIGSYGTENGQFLAPTDLTFGSKGHIWVSDGANNCIQEFSATGSFISKWGISGSEHGQLLNPAAVSADSAGNIYVADYNNDRVQKFSSKGKYQLSFGEPSPKEFVYPHGLALDLSGKIYVSDIAIHRIQKFDKAGKFVTTWGKAGTGKAQFRYPYNLATDSAGSVYIADFDNHRIQKFNSVGSPITSWGVLGFADGQLNNPMGVAVDSGGYVYVVENGNKRVQKFTSKGQYITKWGSAGSGNGQFECPNAIAVDSTGNVYVTDEVNGNIQKFNSTGTYITNWTLNEPWGVAVDSDDNVFVTDVLTSSIEKYSPSGDLIATWGTSGNGDGEFYNPAGIAVDPDGFVYVADCGNTRIQVFEKVPNLTITGISPESGPNTGKFTGTIKGKDIKKDVIAFLTNSTVSIQGSVSFLNKTTISCSFPLAGAPTRIYNCTLRNPDGQTSTLVNAFRVTNTTPSITSVSPASGFNAGSTELIITGTSFRPGVAASLIRDSSTSTGTVTSRTSTKIVCSFPLTGLPTGLYNLTVLNGDGSLVTKNNSFTVKQAGTSPTITGFSPDSGYNTGSLPFIINGTNFRKGATVTIANGTTGKTVAGTVTGSTRISCSFPLTGLPAGLYNLTVLNTDKSSVIWQDAFTVKNPAPSITSVTPSTGYIPGSPEVTIAGSKFIPGAEVALVSGSTRIPGSVTSLIASKIICTFVLTGATPGPYNLTVTNPGGLNGTKPFTLLSPGTDPVIGSFSPPSGINTGPVSFMVTGNNFLSGASITITNGTAGRTVSGTVTGSTSIKCSLPLTGLPAGLYNLTIRNSDGSSGTRNDAFIVNSPTPSIISLSPSGGYAPGSSDVTVKGSKFSSGAEVALVSGGTRIPGSVTSLTSGMISCTFVLTGAAPGFYNLTVTNPGGPNATKLNIFTVHSAGTNPSITAFSPASGMNTVSLPFTVTGDNFRTKATITITNGSTSRTVTGSLVTGNEIRCSLPLKGLPYGLYNLTIMNTDGSSASRMNGFTVTNPDPAITRIKPATGYNTGTVTVTITGSRFAPGASITFLNGSTTVSGSVVSLSASSITGSFPLTGIPAGVYNLTVSNPLNANETKPNAFTVLAPGTGPSIATVIPASGFNNANLPVTITGSNFTTPAVFLIQGNLHKLAAATSGKKPTGTTLYVTLPLKGIPGGLYNLTVRNSDGVNSTAENVFYVTDMAWISSAQKSVTRSPVVLKPGIVSGEKPVRSPVVVRPSGRRGA